MVHKLMNYRLIHRIGNHNFCPKVDQFLELLPFSTFPTLFPSCMAQCPACKMSQKTLCYEQTSFGR